MGVSGGDWDTNLLLEKLISRQALEGGPVSPTMKRISQNPLIEDSSYCARCNYLSAVMKCLMSTEQHPQNPKIPCSKEPNPRAMNQRSWSFSFAPLCPHSFHSSSANQTNVTSLTEALDYFHIMKMKDIEPTEKPSKRQ